MHSEAMYSVLMAVYAGESPQYLKHSMDSIFQQTVPPNDFVLVCDGNLTAGLDCVINDFQTKYPCVLNVLRMSENKGLAAALNFGLQHCKYEIVARMDSDDIAFPNRIKKQLNAIHDVDVLGSAVMEFQLIPGDTSTLRITPSTQDEIIKFARWRNPFNHPGVMFRKSMIFQVGGYENYSLCEDYHLWVKILLAGGRVRNISDPLVYMRVGGGLFKRRGGVKYLKSMLNFRRWLWKVGFISRVDLCLAVISHALFCLIPNKVRQFLYRNFLRMKY